MNDTITTVPGFRWAARPALAEQDPPHLGGIDQKQHNCIQFRGERAPRWGPRLWRPPPAVCETVVGMDVNTPVIRPACRQARAAPMPIEPVQSSRR
uniref:Uncharacterized protein n=1 Tax=Enterobacter cloacae TaxID=550 RepID=A0A0N7C3M6_ENTCL|nr:hypothetical protein [Enterobacter cloacae]